MAEPIPQPELEGLTELEDGSVLVEGLPDLPPLGELTELEDGSVLVEDPSEEVADLSAIIRAIQSGN